MARQKRPKELSGVTVKRKCVCGNLYVTYNKDKDGKIIEVLPRIGKTGVCANNTVDAICEFISLLLQHGESAESIILRLKSRHCKDANIEIPSCTQVIALEWESLSKTLPCHPRG